MQWKALSQFINMKRITSISVYLIIPGREFRQSALLCLMVDIKLIRPSCKLGHFQQYSDIKAGLTLWDLLFMFDLLCRTRNIASSPVLPSALLWLESDDWRDVPWQWQLRETWVQPCQSHLNLQRLAYLRCCWFSNDVIAVLFESSYKVDDTHRDSRDSFLLSSEMCLFSRASYLLRRWIYPYILH